MDTMNDATFDSMNYSYADVPSPYWFEYLWREDSVLWIYDNEVTNKSEEVN